ncbi:Alpha/Beta hydrolase protein [Sphaerosporella brunnea]|uniref:Alpha/Beta hydrolase protein n=1 Tax=Sphaerosporella brunnea TaxID=1250544 RepID=A0A5J5EH88_9PEZI|nr:Alpha/Beta hydrolase protein [Sphaerosporella brunnea]
MLCPKSGYPNPSVFRCPQPYSQQTLGSRLLVITSFKFATMSTEPHIHEPSTTHTHTIILLHGRGSNGPDFAEELFEGRTSGGLSLAEQFPGWRWVFPTAKARWSTVFREEMTEWFDIYSLHDPDAEQQLQHEGLQQALQVISTLVEEEAGRAKGFEKVVLGGISQGAATAIMALLCGGQRLGAFVGVSGWLPFARQMEGIVKEHEGLDAATHMAEFLRGELCGSNTNLVSVDLSSALATPVFFGHGTDDQWVDVKLGKQAYEILHRGGVDAKWMEYKGAEQERHWLKEPEEFDDIVEFLRQHVVSDREE